MCAERKRSWSILGILFYRVCGHTQNSNLNFLLGLTVGLVVAFLVSSFSALQGPLIYTQQVAQQSYQNYMNSRSLQEVEANTVSLHDELDKRLQPVQEVQFDDHHHHHDNDEIARNLSEQIRVLCWVMTSPQNLDKKAVHVKKTWGKRCTKLVFFSSETNKTFPTIGLNISEGRQHLTAKTMRGFKYVYDNFFEEADWFMKADDDTYVILENLRYFLSSQSTKDPVYFGHHFKTIVKQGYYSGGAGYILSKEALKRLGTTGQSPKYCRQDGGAEDAELGKCMQSLGVKTVNSTDALGRSRFHCFDLETHLFGGYPNWYYKYDANGAKKGVSSISDYAISFHYVNPQKMYALEFYIYHLRPYGIESGHQQLNKVGSIHNTKFHTS